MTVTATAFNNTPEQTDDKPRLGAWEDVIKPGMKIIAVSHDLLDRGLDRGTQVAIDGEYTVLDKMDDRWTKRIDIYMGRDEERAKEWGEKEVTINWCSGKG